MKVDYRAALLEILMSKTEWLSIEVNPVEVGIDGHFSGPALSAAVKALHSEGLIKTDSELRQYGINRAEA